MGSVQSTNIALIGFAAAHPRFPFIRETLRAAVEQVTPIKFRDTSLRIFDRCHAEGKKRIKVPSDG